MSVATRLRLVIRALGLCVVLGPALLVSPTPAGATAV